ncbi:hypothetical protein [Bradyrhizobium sp.]|jgi:hypothetical protein|uniref:hypothetical protein n=1 Tax=Bradyrhizobium sp. TaxID=376 RepID=UPI003C7BF1FB
MTKWLFAAALTTALAGISTARANDGCGPGCHTAVNGGCVVNGWESGARVWNECPAGAHPRPPCGAGYVWSRSMKACMLR